MSTCTGVVGSKQLQNALIATHTHTVFWTNTLQIIGLLHAMQACLKQEKSPATKDQADMSIEMSAQSFLAANTPHPDKAGLHC